MPGHPLLWEQRSHRGPEGHDLARKCYTVSPEEWRYSGARFAQDVMHRTPSRSCPRPPSGWQPRLLQQRSATAEHLADDVLNAAVA
eukprot:5443782-Heterocapsa_arctica.AAC.1